MSYIKVVDLYEGDALPCLKDEVLLFERVYAGRFRLTYEARGLAPRKQENLAKEAAPAPTPPEATPSTEGKQPEIFFDHDNQCYTIQLFSDRDAYCVSNGLSTDRSTINQDVSARLYDIAQTQDKLA